jgi:hypothetical protein
MIANMNIRIIQFLDILITGLVAGIIFGILIGHNPQYLSALAYVEQQQSTINALNVLMPILGFVAIMLTIFLAILNRKNKVVLSILLIASLLLIISGLVTRFGNQPINTIVMQWKLTEIPSNWTLLRHKWWTFHTVRAITSLIGFALIAWTTTIQK